MVRVEYFRFRKGQMELAGRLGKRNLQSESDGDSGCSATQAAIWARDLSSNFLRILCTWVATVCSERTNWAEVWRFVSPRPTRAATSRSRRVSRVHRLPADGSPAIGVVVGAGRCSERAYSAAASSPIARPSAQAASQAASPSWARAAAI